MVNRPFRVAFWALAVNLGMSLCLLMSDPEVVRLALHTSPAPRPGGDRGEPSAVQVADASPGPGAATPSDARSSRAVAPDTQPTSASVPETNLPPETHQGSTAIADTGERQPSIDRVYPETPPLPIREVSTNNEAGYPWTLHDASRMTFGTGKFEELPPPPEFADEVPAAESTAESAELDHEMATQLAGLGERLDDLHGELAELRTSHTAVERTLTELAALSASMAAETRAAESPLEIRAVVMQAPLTGELHDGVLPALRRSGAAGDISVDDASWHGVSWSVSNAAAGVVTSWLQRIASTGRMAQRTIRLSPGAAGSLDLWRLLPPRMIQARGSFVFERAPRPAWGGGLELRCPAGESAGIGLEFRTCTAADPATASSSDWRQATIPEAGTLIVTGQCHEHVPRIAEDGERALPHEQPVGRSEIVVILSMRRVSAGHEAAPEPARLLPIIEAPELNANPE